jgi:hypothetical protein
MEEGIADHGWSIEEIVELPLVTTCKITKTDLERLLAGLDRLEQDREMNVQARR